MVFFLFFDFQRLLHFIAFGLTPSGLSSDGFFLFFDFQRLFGFFCRWFKALGFRLRWILFLFFDFQRLLHFIAFGLMPSGLSSDCFFLFF